MRSFIRSLAHASLAACLLSSVAPGCSGTLAVGREMDGGVEGGSVGEAGPVSEAGSSGPHGEAGTGEGPPHVEAGVGFEAGVGDAFPPPIDANNPGGPCTTQADCPGGTVCALPPNTCGTQAFCVTGTLSGPCNVIVPYCSCTGTQTGVQCPEIPMGYLPVGGAYWGQCEGGTCGGIGAPCSASEAGTCPVGMLCYGASPHGFCAPSTQCGGLAGLTCPSGLVCITPTGCADCFGSCVTPADVSCICPADSAWATCPDGG
jgi:hypothetical protein